MSKLHCVYVSCVCVLEGVKEVKDWVKKYKNRLPHVAPVCIVRMMQNKCVCLSLAFTAFILSYRVCKKKHTLIHELN